jgi:hypothetical protein
MNCWSDIVKSSDTGEEMGIQLGSKKVKLSLCLTTTALRHEDVWGSGYIHPRIDHDTSWKWVVSFTPWPLYMPSNDRMINCDGCGRKWSCPGPRFYPAICLDGLGESTKYIRCPGRTRTENLPTTVPLLGLFLFSLVSRSIHFISLLFLFWNKKFWEELIAYFPWYDTGHIENDASNNSSLVACVFVTAVMFLPSRCLATIGKFLLSCCLATIGGYTDTHRQQRDLISLLCSFKIEK